MRDLNLEFAEFGTFIVKEPDDGLTHFDQRQLMENLGYILKMPQMVYNYSADVYADSTTLGEGGDYPFAPNTITLHGTFRYPKQFNNYKILFAIEDDSFYNTTFTLTNNGTTLHNGTISSGTILQYDFDEDLEVGTFIFGSNDYNEISFSQSDWNGVNVYDTKLNISIWGYWK